MLTNEYSSPNPYVMEFARAVPARADYELPTCLHMRAVTMKDNSPAMPAITTQVAALSAEAFAIARSSPEALDTRATFRSVGVPVVRRGRYIDGSMFASLKASCRQGILHYLPSILIARRRWDRRHLNSIVTRLGGDYHTDGLVAALEVKGRRLMIIPRTKTGTVTDDDAISVFHPGTLRFGERVEEMAMTNFTVYKDGPLSSLSIHPPAGGDLPNHLRHRLLDAGCGYQARTEPYENANTYYVVHWPPHGQGPPHVYLHLREAIPRFGEITRPMELMNKGTRHYNIA
jgi:hypothetical protein